jgi:hypothetical protein
MTLLAAGRKIQSFPQAASRGAAIPSLAVESDGVVRHLGPVARRRRKEADKLIAEVIAVLRQQFGVKVESDGTLSRFERGLTTPRYLDKVIAAYAAETGDDVAEFWADALEEYRAARPVPAPPPGLLQPRQAAPRKPQGPSPRKSRRAARRQQSS